MREFKPGDRVIVPAGWGRPAYRTATVREDWRTLSGVHVVTVDIDPLKGAQTGLRRTFLFERVRPL